MGFITLAHDKQQKTTTTSPATTTAAAVGMAMATEMLT